MSATEERAYARVTLRLLPFLGLCYLIAYLDRVNVGFAKLHMLTDLGMSEAAYGFGAGIFFIGYFLFEVPSNLALHRVGARMWIARIMMTWGIISGAMAFVEPLARATGLEVKTVFYSLRFLLGAAEAGFFPGVLLYLNYWYPSHRQSRVIALLLMAQPFAFVFGAPLSGAIMESLAGVRGLHDWQWMFLIEAVPALVLGIAVLFYLDNRIDDAAWLAPDQKLLLKERLASEAAAKGDYPLRKLFAIPAMWLFTVILFCIVTGVYGINFWLPTIIRETGIESVLVIGGITAACYFSSAVISVLATRRAERRDQKRWHAAGAAILGGVCLALSAVWTDSTVITAVLLSLATSGALVATALFWSFPGSMLTGAGIAAGLAAINSFGNLGGFVGPYLLGLLTDWFGSRTVGVGVLGGFMACGGVLIALGCRSYGLRVTSAAPAAAAAGRTAAATRR
ncbi:MAG: MFS transporter [Steroidobacteraceae bacterium]